jgi:hypothetical protein
MAEERFNKIIRDCQRFGFEMWSAISRVHNDAEVIENSYSEHANRIDVIRLLKAEDHF